MTEPETQPPAPTNVAPAFMDVPADRPVEELSPEEQLALYEKELKESDWGHQPC